MIASTAIDGCSVAYEVLGEGTPVVLTPGARNPMEAARPIAEQLATRFQVILWDRANIGRSDVAFTGARDLDLWSDQLAGLLRRLGTGPAFLCGPSAGCRVSFTTALRYPELVRGMYLWLMSGGPVGVSLREGYYGQYATMAAERGMEAVAADPYWAERIAANPANRGRLLGQDPDEFAAVMTRWAQAIRPEDALFGATADDLRAISVPTAILTADEQDSGHPRDSSLRAAELIPDVELIEDETFQAEWPPLQAQALANYERPPSLPRLIAAWLTSATDKGV